MKAVADHHALSRVRVCVTMLQKKSTFFHRSFNVNGAFLYCIAHCMLHWILSLCSQRALR
jgi:uncharacterized membrane protein